MKIKFGSIVTDGRNKLGGHVYSKNRGGNYVRTNAIPNNPRSPGQQRARGIFSMLSTAWRGLTEQQRSSWFEFADRNPYLDQFGDSKTLSGNAAFVRSNTNLINIGLSTIDTPSLVQARFIGIDMELKWASSPDMLSLAFAETDTSDMETGQVLVYATEPSPASQRYAENKLRIIGSYESTDVVQDAIDITTDYVARFGSPTTGARVTVKALFVGPNGLTSFVGESTVII